MLEVRAPGPPWADRPRRPAARRRRPRGSRRARARCPGRFESASARAAASSAGSGSAGAPLAGGSSRSSRSFSEPFDRVQAEAVDTALAPEADHACDRLSHLGVTPVEVGLLGIEGVQVPARRCARRGSRPGRRTPPASCSAARRRRPTRSSRGARGTTGARSRCGTARGRAERAGRARGPRRQRVEVRERAERGSTPV